MLGSYDILKHSETRCRFQVGREPSELVEVRAWLSITSLIYVHVIAYTESHIFKLIKIDGDKKYVCMIY